jgi:hypothetical protein
MDWKNRTKNKMIGSQMMWLSEQRNPTGSVKTRAKELV